MRLDVPVGPNGYVWWYVDALSRDGAHGITIIAFLGSVFSPYYAWRRRSGPANPLEHCALNVAVYGQPARWAMTERGAAQVERDTTRLRIGPSGLSWDGHMLTITIDERTMPKTGRIRGTVRVHAPALTGAAFALDAAGLHRWSPPAPSATVEVALEAPAVQWSGPGYLDTNDGDAPLEEAFARWDWCRAPMQDGTAILYEATERSGESACVTLHVSQNGAVTPLTPPPPVTLPRTRWRIARATRAEHGDAHVVRTLEDTPFYARSVLASRLLGERVMAIHESLSLDRFRSPWVQAMLPFRMPRRGNR